MKAEAEKLLEDALKNLDKAKLLFTEKEREVKYALLGPVMDNEFVKGAVDAVETVQQTQNQAIKL